MSTEPRPFSLRVAEEALVDLRDRLARTRFPDQAPGEPWASGTNVAWMRDLVEYWRQDFDWRAQEARLNQIPQYKVALHGIDVHFLHVPGKGPAPCPLLLSHGWPGSVFEFLEVIPRLTDPARFGGDPADAFTVVAPSLPGYGLSFAPGQPRFGVEAIAACFADLMTDVLGYRRFAAQGGDWGCFVTTCLGHAQAERMIGIHLNLLPLRRDPKMVANPSAEERHYLEELAAWLKE
ncbi:MAG TPA: epoxide hydrolase, partial [Stellaceae bacterium]|nr:epoxide hydrolase [Stellaceae bacterium]